MPLASGTAVVSGALSIIGSACADYLAANGYDLVLIDRDRQCLNTLAQELTTRSRRAVEVVAVEGESSVDRAAVTAMIDGDASVVLLVDIAGVPVDTGFADDRATAPVREVTRAAMRKFSLDGDEASAYRFDVVITATRRFDESQRLL